MMTQDNTGCDAAAPVMTDADIEAMVADRSAGTPDLGGWAWLGGRDSLYLATRRGGRRFVMDFVRKGMRSAQPRFQIRGCMHNAIDDLTTYVVGDGTARGQNQAVADSSVYRLDVAGVDHPDARRLARVPAMEQTILALRAELAARPAPIGAAWMREQAADAIDKFLMTKTDICMEKICDAKDAIRAIPLPTDADLLAEAMKLPEVVALVLEASNLIEACDRLGVTGGNLDTARAAIAPFTAAKETP